MSQDTPNANASLACELDVTAPASVAPSLGYPNNRVEGSPTRTGWQASVVLATGLPDQAQATVTKIGADGAVER